MPASSSEFILTHFKDAVAGGYHAVTDCTGRIVVSGDKRLADQVEAALLFIGQKDAEEASFAIAALDRLFDSEQSGFAELTDRYWNPHGVGVVRTLALQLDAARAYLLYGRYFDEPSYIEKSGALLAKVERLAEQGLLAAVYSADWSTPLDVDSGLDLEVSATSLAATLLEAGKNDRISALIPYVERLLARLGDGQITDHPRELLTCEARAKIVLAVGRWARATSDIDLENRGRRYLLETAALYRCARYGGFWNRVNGRGKAHADAQLAYRKGESPFPIKRTLDAALLLLAFREYGCQESALEQELLGAVNHFGDAHSGGHFLGIGYFWSTPADPTVPFARQFWAAPMHPGVFSIGNLTYLPLHIKTLETQIACAHLSKSGVPRRSTDNADVPPANGDLELEDIEIDGNFEHIHHHDVIDLNVDLDRYLAWLDRTRSSALSLYGLTAELSPLGFRADRAGQLFSTLHVVSDLRALNRPIPDDDDLARVIRSCQNEDGGFSEQPGQLSDVFATYCGAVLLRLLGSRPHDVAACIAYVQRCQNADGGYGNVPGLRSDIWHSNLAILSLHALSTEPADRQAALRFVQSCRTKDGAYSNMPSLPPDTFSTYRALSTLTILGKIPADQRKTVEWLRALQQPNGPFLYRPGHARSLVGTYMAIAALQLLGAKPEFGTEAITWIEAHQKQDGGFGPLGTTSATTDESFVCIQTLLILKGLLTDHWVAAVN